MSLQDFAMGAGAATAYVGSISGLCYFKYKGQVSGRGINIISEVDFLEKQPRRDVRASRCQTYNLTYTHNSRMKKQRF